MQQPNFSVVIQNEVKVTHWEFQYFFSIEKSSDQFYGIALCLLSWLQYDLTNWVFNHIALLTCWYFYYWTSHCYLFWLILVLEVQKSLIYNIFLIFCLVGFQRRESCSEKLKTVLKWKLQIFSRLELCKYDIYSRD